MSLNNLNTYAHFRRWQQAAETSPDAQPGPALTGAQVWLVHFSGRDWEGPFDRAAYLCLTLAEAQMVVGEVAGPRPKVSRLGFEAYINARIEAVPLAQVLQDEALKPLLLRRLKRLAAHPLGDVARGPHHQAPPGKFGVQGRHLDTCLPDGVAQVFGNGHHQMASVAARSMARPAR